MIDYLQLECREWTPEDLDIVGRLRPSTQAGITEDLLKAHCERDAFIMRMITEGHQQSQSQDMRWLADIYQNGEIKL